MKLIAIAMVVLMGCAGETGDGSTSGDGDGGAGGQGGAGGAGGAVPATILCVTQGDVACETLPDTAQNRANCDFVGELADECPFATVGCCTVEYDGEMHTTCWQTDDTADECGEHGGTWS